MAAEAPLDGILVVTLEQAVAAPMCSSRLADAGARVIKIERPEGDFARNYDHVVDGESAYFVWLNRGKESVTLNIKDPGDVTLLKRIILASDVYIQNLVPGAAERAGVGCEAMREANPRLITCEISGYGNEGPYRHMKAYDLLVQAESGLCSVTGTPEAPGRVGVSVCDIAAGMNALAGIYRALFSRERTGRGRGLRASLFDGMADWMTVPYLYQVYGGEGPKRAGLSHPMLAPYGAYPTGDGKQVLISIQNEREWRVLCETILEQPALVDDPRFNTPARRFANRRVLDAIVADCFKAHDREALMARLSEARLACGALNEVSDLAAHPQLRTIAYPTISGSVEVIAPALIDLAEEPEYGRVPSIGEHNESIRKEFAA